MSSPETRRLLVTADDFGIGPETTRGILDLAARGIVTSTVLLVNSPFAEEGVAAWRKAGGPVELGWHPCLTLDSPILPANQLPSLVGSDGRFHSLGNFLKRLMSGRISEMEVHSEFSAQYQRFLDIAGFPPPNVNGHHHIHSFGKVGRILRSILAGRSQKPFVRRVNESTSQIVRVPGARVKRFILSTFGNRSAKAQSQQGFPGAEYLVGITDPKWVSDPEFFVRWLSRVKGNFIELTCHPGYFDDTLFGRDGTKFDGNVERRPNELALLSSPTFLNTVERYGFQLVKANGNLQFLKNDSRIAA